MKQRIPDIFRLAAILAGIGGSCTANAADASFAMKVGYDFGGEKMIEVPFTDGGTGKIYANDGLFIGAGVSILNEDRNFETELTANFKYQSIEASNGSITWTRWPIDALFFYRTQNVRVGGGLTYHMNPKLDGSGVVGGLNVKLDDSLGKVLQIDYRFGEWGSLGVRYTMLEYDLQGSPAVKSNGAGIVLSGRF